MSTSFAFYICDGFQLLDLSGPMAALDAANLLLEQDFYRIALVSKSGGFVQGDAALGLTTPPPATVASDTIIVVGGRIDPMQDAGNVAAIRHAAASASSIASICTDAFLMAAAGFLDNRRATTY